MLNFHSIVTVDKVNQHCKNLTIFATKNLNFNQVCENTKKVFEKEEIESLKFYTFDKVNDFSKKSQT